MRRLVRFIKEKDRQGQGKAQQQVGGKDVGLRNACTKSSDNWSDSTKRLV